MNERRIVKFLPDLEPLEAKRPLSTGGASAAVGERIAGPLTSAPVTSTGPGPIGSARVAMDVAHQHRAMAKRSLSSAGSDPTLSALGAAVKPNYGYLVYRITNPNRFNNSLTPPFTNVLTQVNPPVPGKVYNILYVAVRNGTSQTFDAGSGFEVKFPGQDAVFPILTGTQQWRPGGEFVFYVLTNQYYPLPSVVHSGFEFSLGGARSVAIPGPSGIFLRIKYNPDTIDKVLDHIVAHGPGAQGGKGIRYGLPDTAIYEFLSSKTNRSDFGGYF